MNENGLGLGPRDHPAEPQNRQMAQMLTPDRHRGMVFPGASIPGEPGCLDIYKSQASPLHTFSLSLLIRLHVLPY